MLGNNYQFLFYRDLSVIKTEQKHDLVIRTLKFKNSNIITGSPDFRLRINATASKSLINWMKLLFLVILALSIYIAYKERQF